jgi:hypothetical protein
MQRTIERTVTETIEALSWLVEQGYLLRDTTGSSRSIFRLNPKKRDAAGRLMKRTRWSRAS